ncbi:unnamed protein product [Heligmosomoides polygyrus]|uniref:Toxin n=1 Tax=Heligmosomoides polygyrus TaxID=6339 RepID=A0A183G145_HELPZ|nr:unnamed protein product [Heligmosomoides polygyrus]
MSRIPLLLVLLVAAVGAYDPYEHVCDDIDNPDRAQTAENACATLCYMEFCGKSECRKIGGWKPCHCFECDDRPSFYLEHLPYDKRRRRR